ncbi:FAD-dependent oxidoreductase, partial [Pseudomonas sp. K5002]
LHLLDKEQAQARAGITLEHGGLFFPEGGWVHPPALCEWQARHPLIEVLQHHDALELKQVDSQWQALQGDTVLAQASVVVLAGAAEIKRFSFSADLPLKRIRGQITRLPQTAQSQALATVVCAEGYVAPPRL